MPKPLSSIRKFYLLDYFYVLLISVDKSPEKDQIFDIFSKLKKDFMLGESKYRKITVENETLSKRQIDKYHYTFEKVIAESIEYDLIIHDNGKYYLTQLGKNLILQYQSNFEDFALTLFELMETKYEAFRQIIELLYKASRNNNGLITFPVYSPLQLGIDRSKIQTTKNIIAYSDELARKLEFHLKNFDYDRTVFEERKKEIITTLINDNMIPLNESDKFDPKKYNAIVTRFRDFWRKYFLQEIYHYNFYLTSFDIWVYRAKQIGILQATEFFPNFNGKIIYPTSVLIRTPVSPDFREIYTYSNGTSLCLHKPNIDGYQNRFVDSLVNAYYKLKKNYRSYFISLLALKELVCYNLKISDYTFQECLNAIYKANLSGILKIKISLEVDRLPEETKATYLKREPILVDGKARNIVAIDVAGGRDSYEVIE